MIPIKGCGLGDDDAGDATFNSSEGVLNLRLHATGDGAIGHKMVEFIAVDVADDAGVVVGVGQDAGLLETVDEGNVVEGFTGTVGLESRDFIGAIGGGGSRNVGLECDQGAGGLRGDGIGVGVEQMAHSIVGEGCKDGSDALLQQLGQTGRIDAVDITDEAVVDAVAQWALMAADDIDVGTGQSDGIHAEGLQAGDELLIDQATVDHRDHAEHLGVGDAAAVDHVALDAEGRGNLRCAAASAMHENLWPADGGEGLEELGQALFVFNDGTADFDYSNLFHER